MTAAEAVDGGRRRSGGREARRERRSGAGGAAAPAFITRQVPTYELLGEEGRPFVASMKRIRPELKAMAKAPGKQAKNTQQALDRLDEVVKAWEAEFGSAARQ